ncbi:MAG: hypothetical protein ACRCSK_05380 [Fusobacteriaceae bacterium]
MKFSNEFINKLNSKEQEIYYTETFKYSKRSFFETIIQLVFSVSFMFYQKYYSNKYFTADQDKEKLLFTIVAIIMIVIAVKNIFESFLYKLEIDILSGKIMYRIFKHQEINFMDIDKCYLENMGESNLRFKLMKTPYLFVTMKNSKKIKIHLEMNLEKKYRLILMMKQILKEKFSIDKSFYN